MLRCGFALFRSYLVTAFALSVLSPPAPAFAVSEQSESIEMAAPAVQVRTFDLNLSVRAGQTSFDVPAPSPQERAGFDVLSASDQAEFLEHREEFMSQLVKGFSTLKYGFGLASLAKDRLTFAFDRLKTRASVRAAEKMPETARADYEAAKSRHLDEVLAKADADARLTLRQRSNWVITSLLQKVDKNLWSHAKVFAHANEYGLMASVGLQGLGGVEGKGGWGGLFDVGISIGFNRDTMSLVLQIFRDFERFESTSMKAVFVAGVVGKGGGYVANQKNGESVRKGTTFYPPMIPGFLSTTDASFVSGFSSGFTWPPSPLGDLLTYTNRLEQNSLLRVSISPLLRGFVRIETGLGLHTLKFFVMPIVGAVNYARELLQPGLRCRALFL